MLKIMSAALLMLTTTSWVATALSYPMMFIISLFLMTSSMNSINVTSPIIAWDLPSMMLVSLTLWITPLIFMASQTIYIKNVKMEWFSLLLKLLMIILIMSFISNNPIMFYIMFEASLIPTLLIILMYGYQPERLQAGKYMMMYTVIASLPFMMMLLFSSKSTSFMCSSPTWMTSYISVTEWAVLNLAMLTKLPMFLLHLWLPKAHLEAPVAGSMILAAVLLKLGGYGIMRMSELFGHMEQINFYTLGMVALWGGMITSIICTRQSDLKALIAYSSIGHMALIITGIASATKWGLAGSLAMMISHGLVSSALFASANHLYENFKSRSMVINKGVLIMAPMASMMWFIMMCANMAAPPSINLMAEIMLISSSSFISMMLVIPLATISFITMVYSMIAYTSINHGPTLENNACSFMVTERLKLMTLAHMMPVFLIISSPQIIT